ncbi:MAG: DUF4856 domain-containing protein [Bacteroidota bacterium]
MSAQTFKLMAIALLISMPVLQSCDDNSTGSDNENEIDVPKAYYFESRFEEGEISVAYPGQVVRNLLVQDLKIYTDLLGSDSYDGGSITEQDLLNYYEYKDSYDMATLTDDGNDLTVEEDHYSNIATGKDLVGKISDDPIIGAGYFDGKTADALIREWIGIIAQNSQDPAKRGTPAIYTTENNLNLSQMINKVLLGAVTYHQATGKYLVEVLDQDNSEARNDGAENFTAMEHYWDEAFGYFGAARNYSDYSDSELSSGTVYKDYDGNAIIDLNTEYNFTYATYAGKRDNGGDNVDFTSDIFTAFLEGRTNIVNQASTDAINANIQEIVLNWEKLVAANVIHYINATIADMNAASFDQYEYNEHWAEMRAFVIVLQYNPYKQITDGELQTLANLMGDQPATQSEFDSYATDLETARDNLQSIYGFSDTNVNNW